MVHDPGSRFLAPELLATFAAEARDHLTAAEAALLRLERAPGDPGPTEEVFRAVHSLKGSAAPLGLGAVRDLAHAMEDLLAGVRARRLSADPALVGDLLAGVDALRALIDQPGEDHLRGERLALIDRLRQRAGASAAAAAGNPAAADPLQQALRLCSDGGEDLEDRLARLLSQLPARAAEPQGAALADEILAGWNDTVPAGGLTPVVRDWLAGRLAALALLPGFLPPPPAAPAAESAAAAVEATVRVPAQRIDDLLRLVGDLLELGDRLGRMPERVRRLPGGSSEARELSRLADELGRATDSLRHTVLEVRRMPAGALLPRLQRVLRDACASTGKQAALVGEGMDLEIDKTLVELLDAQLPHLVRNSIDHGIEAPPARQAAGKAPAGTLRLSALRRGNEVVLELADDGAGIDLARLRAHAEAMGLLAPGQHASDEEIADLVFAPGLTTATRVTELSGRGVGMDAVRRAVEGAGGRIAVATRPGQGLRTLITLPAAVTTRIFAGYLVRAGSVRAALPLERVRETFRPRPEDLSGTGNGGIGVLRHGRVLPVLGLAAALGATNGEQDRAEVLVTVLCRRRTLALAVDEVLGVQQVVVRPLEGLDTGGRFTGAALLGDGAVALVLDPDSLADPIPAAVPARSPHA
ncbi:MAG: chemotaxis protein CheW [Planctomycetes bacterium]|nr:chemotaxis protein CheW [Planctomycetota bacterium]